MRLFDKRLEVIEAVGVLCDLIERVTLLAGPFKEVAEFIRVNTADFHFLAEGAAIEGRGVDVVVPHQVQVIDVFDGD
ncbi:hypothetical protein PM076_15185 [Halorubrum ezzemoulense]|uniref:Uncharacterized protein n=1 Tax=Halorubrum ezzemoulense TaxID=337243 RepID=A0ABT4Z7K6_HALEZ|nr:hypothetical protein [Halorubrum ezzemoulense]MDB2279794.1 hypothetical protein [Halorubrum ezzemoulense]MDB2290220.1 hypothetical protein [Halorubrum ezzemoulense]MDB2294139.1 hypothetical protein [Halorubrum ezzemoulense]MDB2297618.1 hypothetical protein [Halorubrum ezzemoulense]